MVGDPDLVARLDNKLKAVSSLQSPTNGSRTQSSFDMSQMMMKRSHQHKRTPTTLEPLNMDVAYGRNNNKTSFNTGTNLKKPVIFGTRHGSVT